MPLDQFTSGIKLQQLASDLLGRPLNAILDVPPPGLAQFTQTREPIIGPDVAAQSISLIDGNIEAILAAILDEEVLLFPSLQRSSDQATEDANAVLHVDDVVTRRQIGEAGFGSDLAAVDWPSGRRPTPAKDLAVSEQLSGRARRRLKHPALSKSPTYEDERRTGRLL
jgi:hypothetical protein